MHYFEETTGLFPDWQADSEKRLRVSLLFAALFVAGLLSLFRLPAPIPLAPLFELVVDIVQPRQLPEAPPLADPPIAEPLPVPAQALPQPSPVDTAEPQADPFAAPEATAPDPAGTAPPDWEVLRDEAVIAAIDAAEKTVSINPTLDAARREARVRFRASLAPGQEHIWDNVEKDQLGRTILRDGNCFHVLSDPSAVNREVFETFDQYTVYCEFSFGKRKGRELPWVEELRQRYPYLRDPVELY
jgi:hypothetical protein